MTSEVVNDTFHRDERILTDIRKFYPEPVWILVLTRLDDVGLENCSRASVYLQSLDSTKTQRRLRLALPTFFSFLSKMEKKYYPNTSEEPQRMQQNNQPIWSYRTSKCDDPAWKLNNLMDCRLVSKKWNSTIEELLQNSRSTSSIVYASRNPELVRLSQETFARMFDVRLFLGYFDETHYNGLENAAIKNPFIGASIRVIINPNTTTFTDEMESLLGKYGHYVRKLEIILVEDSWSGNVRFQRYVQLLRLIALLPQVSCLSLRQVTGHSMVDGEIDGGHVFEVKAPSSLEYLQELEIEIALAPFPHLQNLQSLETEQVDMPILNAILVTNPQIRHLQFQRLYSIRNCVLNMEMNKLRLLNIKLDSAEMFAGFENCVLRNLESLSLEFDFGAPWNPLCRIITAINNNMNTARLVELKISLTSASISMYRRSPNLQLSNLRRFCLATASPVNLDFLIRSNALKCIEIVKKRPGLFDKILGVIPNWWEIQPKSIGKQFLGLRELRVTESDGTLQVYQFLKNREPICRNYQ